ncbi:MAG: DNA-binding protein [Thermomicrobiales bacterium]
MTNHDYSHESDLPPGISAPARRALAGVRIESLEQCATRTEAEILELHGMGPKALGIIRSALDAKGLTFAGVDSDSPSS